jgi:hypothetical protein
VKLAPCGEDPLLLNIRVFTPGGGQRGEHSPLDTKFTSGGKLILLKPSSPIRANFTLGQTHIVKIKFTPRSKLDPWGQTRFVKNCPVAYLVIDPYGPPLTAVKVFLSSPVGLCQHFLESI